MKTLDEYLAMDWSPIIDTVRDGDDVYIRLTVRGLQDFAVHGDGVTDVLSRWQEALASHLGGYLATGKVIPEPPIFEELLTDPADATADSGRGEAVSRPQRVDLISA